MPATKQKPEKRGSRQAVQQINTGEYGALFFWSRDGFAPLASEVIEVKVPALEAGLGRSLGLRLHSTETVIARLKDGLTMKSFEHLSEAIDLSPTKLAGFASIASRTLARRKQEGKLQRAESEKVFRLASLFDRAVEVLGDHGRARSWIKAENRALGGKSPLEYADTEIGAREVEDLLGRLDHGVFS